MIRPLPAMLLALATASCATMSGAPRNAATQPDLIAFETRSWGRTVSGWSIGPDGSGGWWRSTSESGSPGPYGPFRTTYHEIEPGPEGFARVAALLSGLPDPAPVATECEAFRSDDLYGTVRLTRKATTREIAWNAGCEDALYRAFIGKLHAADTLVAGWGMAGRQVRIVRFDDEGKAVSEEILE